jgi:hypothetical protein
MKDGKIDFKSVGITIILAIIGACVGLFDFISQKTNVLNFLAGLIHVQPMAVNGADYTNFIGFGAVVICIFFVAIAMYSVRSMA